MKKRQMLLEGILALAMTGGTTSAWAQPAAGAKATEPAEKAATRPTPAAPTKSAAPTTADDTKKGAGAGNNHEHGAGSGSGSGMGGGGMKGGMMGAGMMGGDCPMMADAGTKMAVKKVARGVVITLTADDAAAVTRLQNMAERMQLKHQAHAK